MEAASIPTPTTHDDHHHGPPTANQSSRVNSEVLGILLFIISEIMLFGAFFAAYFFIRVVSADGWPPGEGLPVAVAGINCAILLSSSVTMHWTDVSAKRDNQMAMRIGIITTFLLGVTFLFIQINEYLHLGFTPKTSASAEKGVPRILDPVRTESGAFKALAWVVGSCLIVIAVVVIARAL